MANNKAYIPNETLLRLEKLTSREPEGFPDFLDERTSDSDEAETSTSYTTSIVSILGETSPNGKVKLAVEWKDVDPQKGRKITLEEEDNVRFLAPEVFAAYLLKRRKPILEAETVWNTLPSEDEDSTSDVEILSHVGESKGTELARQRARVVHLTDDEESMNNSVDSEDTSYSPSEVSYSRKSHTNQSNSKVDRKHRRESAEFCVRCGKFREDTPMMRKGPSGKTELCNACGLRYAKYGKL
eukprot:jgi/Galph1/3741/GphlegSOOS_G2392.1